MAYLRLACVALLLCLPLVAFEVASARARSTGQPIHATMPDKLGEWTVVKEVALQADAEKMLAPDAYTTRLYSAGPNGALVWIYAAFYRGVGIFEAHDPLVCYPAQGWAITARSQVMVDDGVQGGFPAWFMRTEQGTTEDLVLYWFQSAGRRPTTGLSEKLLRAFDRLAGHPEYAFIRLSMARELARVPDPAADLEALESMARAVAPWAHESVTVWSGR